MFLQMDHFLVPYVAGVFVGCANVNASVTAGLNSQKVGELGSLCRRLDLSPVSNVCEAVPMSLFWAPNGLNELPEIRFEFPFKLTGELTTELFKQANYSSYLLKALFRRRT